MLFFSEQLKKSGIPSIAIRIIDESSPDSVSSSTKALDQKVEAAVFEQIEESKAKKPNKPPRNFLGAKKDK